MEQIDFEELIDLGANLRLLNTDKQNENISQKSLQEPLADVLDKMCAAMTENDSVMEDPLKRDTNETKIDTVNIEESEERCVAMIESNLATDDTIKYDIYEGDDDTVENLDEFEHILAGTYLSKNCTDLDETNIIADNNNVTNTVLKGIIKPVIPYNVPIDFGEVDETCASLDEDKNPTSFLNCAPELETLVASVSTADNEIDDEYNLETVKLKDIDISFNEDIINLDEFIDNCCYIADEKASFIDNTTNRKIVESVDSDNVITDTATIKLDLDDSYNSSDFEFISEDEAKKGGLIFKTKVSVKNEGNITGTHTTPYNTNKPSTSNPNRNEASPSEYIKYTKYRYQKCYAELSSEFHVVPEGEQYLDMFRGPFAPVIMNNLHAMTNKSVLPATPMAARFEDLGFSIPENLGEEYPEYKDEAAECSKKILSTYPSENRKRRRRY